MCREEVSSVFNMRDVCLRGESMSVHVREMCIERCVLSLESCKSHQIDDSIGGSRTSLIDINEF